MVGRVLVGGWVSECEHVVTVQHALKDLGGGRK